MGMGFRSVCRKILVRTSSTTSIHALSTPHPVQAQLYPNRPNDQWSPSIAHPTLSNLHTDSGVARGYCTTMEGVLLDLDAFREFREGLALLRDGDAGAAIELLRHAAERDPENSYYVSYYGLGLGLAEGMWSEAERLCHRAVCRGRRQAQLYLNLAEVYLATDRRQAAADTLGLGLHYLPHDPRLQMEFGRLMMRRPPVLPFLSRTNPLNRHLGTWRHTFLQHVPRRRWVTAGESRV
jgi:predicted Zn-dependent protease